MSLDFEPSSLYTLHDLLDGYDPNDPVTYTKTFDFRMFARFVDVNGQAQAGWPDALDFARHDAFIAQHLYDFIRTAEPMLVGVMGGHSLRRDAPLYAAIARLSRRLARQDLQIVTGGGPGVMEAAHVGAASSRIDDDTVLDAALTALKSHAELPKVSAYNPETGVDEGAAAKLQAWFAAGLHVRQSVFGDRLGDSLAIPTWLYGGEPINPFATRYAKFFDNSVSEHSLVNRAKTGIIYAPGGGGTLREVFEDLEENYYAESAEQCTSMVFFDFDNCWTTDVQPQAGQQPHVRIRDVVTQAIRNGRLPQGDTDQVLAQIRYTADELEIADLLAGRRNTTRAVLQRMIAGALPAIRQR